MTKKTLLESLAEANKVQGGTIHQFCDIMADGFEKFVEEFKLFCLDMSFECTTKKGFKKMASRVNYNGLKF